MFYPAWRILQFPKKYEVRRVVDKDFCNKAFNKAKDFAFGVFSCGCSCPRNVTYGFELMLHKESCHNLFRLIFNRDIDLTKLKGKGPSQIQVKVFFYLTNQRIYLQPQAMIFL